MNEPELTMSDCLHDPMIRQMLRADRISLAKFAVILHEAARKREAGSHIRTAANQQGGNVRQAMAS